MLATPFVVAPQPAIAGLSIGVGISVGVAPPPLPVYVQPPCPGPGYIWTPGYWAWDPAFGYYWVPGTWVLPPTIGLLWTPGWWGWSGGLYVWHPGYWGPRVGFYGGINYGFGYFGVGYVGGYWRGGSFWYNRAVNNINVTNIRNVYVNKTVINNYNNVTRVSYNGGRGGIQAQPTAADRMVMNQRHWSPTSMQLRQRELAMSNPAQRFSMNRGRPAIFATQRPGAFDAAHVVRSPAAPMRADAAMPTRMSPATPNGRFGHVVEAPHDRAQPMTQRPQTFRPEGAPLRSENFAGPRPQAMPPRGMPQYREAPPQFRPAPRNMRNAYTQPRVEHAAPRQGPPPRASDDGHPRDDHRH